MGLQAAIDKIMEDTGARFTRKESSYPAAHLLVKSAEGDTEIFPAGDFPMPLTVRIVSYEKRDDGLELTDADGNAMFLYPLGSGNPQGRASVKEWRDRWLQIIASSEGDE